MALPVARQAFSESDQANDPSKAGWFPRMNSLLPSNRFTPQPSSDLLITPDLATLTEAAQLTSCVTNHAVIKETLSPGPCISY